MRIPSAARDLTLLTIGSAVTVLAAFGVLPRGLLVLSVTLVVGASISFVLARHARRIVAERAAWWAANRPDAVRVFRVRERADGGGQSFLHGNLLLNPGGVELIDPQDGRSFAMAWDEIGLIIAEPALRGQEVLEALVVADLDEEVRIALLTPDLDAGATLLAAWPGAVPLPAPTEAGPGAEHALPPAP